MRGAFPARARCLAKMFCLAGKMHYWEGLSLLAERQTGFRMAIETETALAACYAARNRLLV